MDTKYVQQNVKIVHTYVYRTTIELDDYSVIRKGTSIVSYTYLELYLRETYYNNIDEKTLTDEIKNYSVLSNGELYEESRLARFMYYAMQYEMNIDDFKKVLPKFSLDTNSLLMLYKRNNTFQHLLFLMDKNPLVFRHFVEVCLNRPEQGEEFVFLTSALLRGKKHLKKIQVDWLKIIKEINPQHLLVRYDKNISTDPYDPREYIKHHHYERGLIYNKYFRNHNHYTPIHFLVKLEKWPMINHIIDNIDENVLSRKIKKIIKKIKIIKIEISSYIPISDIVNIICEYNL
jgi:hypothetical protein